MDKQVEPPTSVIDDSQRLLKMLNMCELNLMKILFGMNILHLFVLRYLML